MRKIVLMVVMLILITGIVRAVDMNIIKTQIEVQVDDDTHGFWVYTEGDDRHFDLNESCNNAFSDYAWDVQWYSALTTDSGSNNFTGDMKYMLGKVVDSNQNVSGECKQYLTYVRDAYGSMITTINNSKDTQLQLVDCKESKGRVEANYATCQDNAKRTTDYDTIKTQRDNCNTNFAECDTDLTDCTKKKGYWIFYILGGIVAGAFGMDWYKKRGQGGAEKPHAVHQFGEQSRRQPEPAYTDEFPQRSR